MVTGPSASPGPGFGVSSADEISQFEENLLISGDGGNGLKVEELQLTAKLWESTGIEVRGGECLANSIFDQVWKSNHKARGGLEPTELLETEIRSRLERFPGEVLAIRSSAFGEKGGTGTYETKFFVPTDNFEADCKRLTQLALKVYESLFSDKAMAYRISEPTKLGMGLLIQPVDGKWYGDIFTPLLSGSGYTTYEGKTLLRVALGLGTGVVDDDIAFVIDGELPNDVIITDILKHQEAIHGLNRQGEVVKGAPPQELLEELSIASIDKIWKAASQIREGETDLYFEWSASQSAPEGPVIVQSSTYEDKERTALPSLPEEGISLGTTDDIVNHGVKECSVVVEVHPLVWGDAVRNALHKVNKDYKNFLLIVPQEAFSMFQDGALDGFSPVDSESKRLQFDHFRNAAAVVETTYNPAEIGGGDSERGMALLHRHGHTMSDHKGQGGKHFQQICNRKDILFQSIRLVNLKELKELRVGETLSSGISIYHIGATIKNDTLGDQRVGEIVLHPAKTYVAPEYSASVLDSFQEFLWVESKQYEDSDPELANDMCWLCHTIPFVSSEFSNGDPFEPEIHMVEEMGHEAISVKLREVIPKLREIGAPEELLEYAEQLNATIDSRHSS